jgi:DNA repair photolyase
MVVREIQAKGILSKSKVYDYVVNPYTGCQHSCSYCYARFMKRFTGHSEPWGKFVDVKINAPDLLQKEIVRKKRGMVWVSGVCDPYQPLESRYRLTRRCLEILIQHQWPITIQTRSPLVLRDIDIIKEGTDVKVGMTVTTADEKIKRLFEPQAPPIKARIKALEELHGSRISTFAMIAPLLPGAEGLPLLLQGKADYILIDRMNYGYASWVYQKHNIEDKLTDEYFDRARKDLLTSCKEQGLDCRTLF